MNDGASIHIKALASNQERPGVEIMQLQFHKNCTKEKNLCAELWINTTRNNVACFGQASWSLAE